MIKSLTLAAALLLPASALAKVPYFAAKCPGDISVETDRAGRAYLSGKRATVRSKNADYSEIVGGGTTVSVARDAGGLVVTYTGKRGANGVCQVVEQERVESAPPAAAPAPTAGFDDVPAKDKAACLRAVKRVTKNPKAVVLEALSSEANNTVKVGVGAKRAPWRCLVKRGKVADVMSLTDEGAL
jgi:hypothetical protein